MPVDVPGSGRVQPVVATTGVGIGQTRLRGARTDEPPVESGVRVMLRRKAGLTHPKLLLVPFHFQVPPLESYSWEETYAHGEYQTLRAGTLSRAGGRGLMTVSFSTMFVNNDPENDSPALPHEYLTWPGDGDPFWLTEELHSLMRKGTPFWLYVGMPDAREEWDVKMLATLRSLRVEERAGEPETRYADVAFTEYRQAEVRRKRRGPRSKERVVVLERRDDVVVVAAGIPNFSGRVTLARLSKALWGSAAGWDELAKANGIKKVAGSSVEDLLDYMVDRKLKRLRLKVPESPLTAREAREAHAEETANAVAEHAAALAEEFNRAVDEAEDEDSE